MKRRDRRKKTAWIALSAVMAVLGVQVSGQGMNFEAAGAPVSWKVQAAEAQEGIPAPVREIDFNGGLHDLRQDGSYFKIVPAKSCYTTKTEEQLANGEKLDANGIVYEGEGSKASYFKGVVSNQPTSKYDEEKGTYLQMAPSRVIPEIVKSKSAGTENEEETKVLDEKLPFKTASGEGVVVQEEYVANSEMYIGNPFSGEDVSRLVRQFGGASFSYWMKPPVDEQGRWKKSSVLRWETSNISSEDEKKTGELQVDVNGSIFWTPDGESEVSSCAIDPDISWNTDQTGKCADWHQVMVILQEDAIHLYVDGMKIDLANHCAYYAGWGTNNSLLEWITSEEADLHFGGAGVFGTELGMAGVTEDVALDDLHFYAGALSGEEVQAVYQKEHESITADKDTTATSVSLKQAEDISEGIENALQPQIQEIDGKQVYALHVASNERVTKTAGAKIGNPFAGKDLEGATIGYWIRQDDVEYTSALIFMDEEKYIYHPKGTVDNARSILYVENAAEAMFAQGYSNISSCNSVQNTYYTALNAEGKAAQLSKTNEWMYLTVTFSNGGIKYYVNGEILGEDAYYVPTSRFLDGYYQSEKDRKNASLLYGTFGTTGNQGATALMTFLTAEDTAIYLGYYPVKGMVRNNVTSACSFAGIRTVDAALSEEEVKEFYEHRFDGIEEPVPEPSGEDKPQVTPGGEPQVSEEPSATPPAISEPPVQSKEPVEEVLPGDLDGDGKVTLADAQMALKAALKIISLDEKELAAADIDGEMGLGMKDAQKVLKLALKIIE